MLETYVYIFRGITMNKRALILLTVAALALTAGVQAQQTSNSQNDSAQSSGQDMKGMDHSKMDHSKGDMAGMEMFESFSPPIHTGARPGDAATPKSHAKQS